METAVPWHPSQRNPVPRNHRQPSKHANQMWLWFPLSMHTQTVGHSALRQRMDNRNHRYIWFAYLLDLFEISLVSMHHFSQLVPLSDCCTGFGSSTPSDYWYTTSCPLQTLAKGLIKTCLANCKILCTWHCKQNPRASFRCRHEPVYAKIWTCSTKL